MIIIGKCLHKTLSNWIEYELKQVKNELSWADFRVTGYQSIQLWWELVMSSYFLFTSQKLEVKSHSF